MSAGVGKGAPCAEDLPELIDRSLGLYLRPLSRILIYVKLPQLKTAGQSISNWELMEKLKKAVGPIHLEAIRVRESSLEAVQFEAELNSRLNMHRVIQGLDGLSLKVSGFVDALRVRASESKSEFPTRMDWDDHFQRNGRPGRHPDTLFLAMIPVNWFPAENSKDMPSERKLKSAMSSFGQIRAIDIPMLDALRPQMPDNISGIEKKAYSFGQEVLFEAYVQFDNYQGFENAMNRLRDQKWMRRMPDGRVHYANVKVDFDRTLHLSDAKRRMREETRTKIERENAYKEDEERKAKEAEAERLRKEQADKERRKEERELKRKIEYELERRRLERKRLLETRLAEEEKEWAARKATEAKRLLSYVLDRIQARADHDSAEKEAKLKEELSKVETDGLRAALPNDDECKLRAALLKQREVRMRERLKEKMRGLVANVDVPDGANGKEKKDKKKTKKKKEKINRKRRDSSSSECSSSSRDTWDNHKSKGEKKRNGSKTKKSSKHVHNHKRRSDTKSPVRSGDKRKKSR